VGQCAEGYEGVICGSCVEGFSTIGYFECGRCPGYTANTFRILGIFLVAMIFLVFLVRSTLNSADKRKPIHAVYLKIMANHIQMIAAISNIDY